MLYMLNVEYDAAPGPDTRSAGAGRTERRGTTHRAPSDAAPGRGPTQTIELSNKELPSTNFSS